MASNANYFEEFFVEATPPSWDEQLHLSNQPLLNNSSLYFTSTNQWQYYQGDTLFITGLLFKPEEFIAIGIYESSQPTLEYVTAEIVRTNSQGEFTLELDLDDKFPDGRYVAFPLHKPLVAEDGSRVLGASDYAFFSIGDLTSNEENNTESADSTNNADESNSSTNNEEETPSSQAEVVCEGALSTRLYLGAKARVVIEQVNVRQGPGTDYDNVQGSFLKQGRQMTIVDGPVCNSGMLWWKGETGPITLASGEQINMIGWMAEESGDQWLLEPIE